MTRAIHTVDGPHAPALTSAWFRRRGLFGGLILGTATALALASNPYFGEDTWIELAIDLLAWSMFLTGVAVRLWATLYVGGRKEQTLVTAGPYSITRNPLYFGSFLIALSLGVFLQSLMFIACVLLVAWLHTARTIRAEEQVLREIHGAAFDAYCAHTPRLIPAPRCYETPAIVEVNVSGLRRELHRVVRWIALAMCMELISHLREAPWWPHLLGLP